jgi:tripartite-type tricarboxylate transporter receptor subunit TctC
VLSLRLIERKFRRAPLITSQHGMIIGLRGPVKSGNHAVNRRSFLQLALAVAAAGSRFAFAQAYPARPLRILVPFPAGGTMDSVVRPLANELAKGLGQPVIVENKPGAGTVIAVNLAAKSAPDGYTLVCIGNSFAVNQSLVHNLPYDSTKDFRPISLLTATPNVLVGRSDIAAHDVPELVSYAKANPGELSYGSFGNGTIQHLAAETFKSMAGIDLLHVPYQGAAPAINALLGGQVDLIIGNLPEILPQIRAHKFKAFGVTTSKRSPMAPDLPTIAEQGYPGFETYAWFGVLTPAGVPDPVALRLNREIVRALALPEIQNSFAARGVDTLTSTPEEFEKFLQAEILKYAKVIKEANIRLD